MKVLVMVFLLVQSASVSAVDFEDLKNLKKVIEVSLGKTRYVVKKAFEQDEAIEDYKVKTRGNLLMKQFISVNWAINYVRETNQDLTVSIPFIEVNGEKHGCVFKRCLLCRHHRYLSVGRLADGKSKSIEQCVEVILDKFTTEE